MSSRLARLAGLLKVLLPAMVWRVLLQVLADVLMQRRPVWLAVWRVLQVLADVSMLPAVLLSDHLDFWSGCRVGCWCVFVLYVNRENDVVKKSQGVIECGDPDSEQGPIDPEQAAKLAVTGYDPSEDPRLWKAVAGMWKSVCVEFVDVACGYVSDGRPASEIAARLQRELADRLQQESNAAGEFREQFRRTAAEWLVRRRSDVVTADMHRQMMELDREREAAAARALEQDRQSRERQAAELEAKAAALRQGPQGRTTSFLAR